MGEGNIVQILKFSHGVGLTFKLESLVCLAAQLTGYGDLGFSHAKKAPWRFNESNRNITKTIYCSNYIWHTNRNLHKVL